jgi:hypothetical protein
MDGLFDDYSLDAVQQSVVQLIKEAQLSAKDQSHGSQEGLCGRN